jgi:DNA-binding GntR family transcriptional regulator
MIDANATAPRGAAAPAAAPAAAAAPPAASVTEAAYHRLRHALLAGEVMPGAKLKIGELCERMGFNLSAMREALTRLAAEGVVVAEPQRGFRAAPISAEDLADLTRVRIDIETICLVRSMEHGDVAWEAGVVAAAHALARTPKPNPTSDVPGYAQWRTVHAAFHDALCAGCGSPWLLRLREQLNVQNQRYLWLSLKLSGGRRAADEEHRRLAEAVLARSFATVPTLISDHFLVTTNSLLESPLLNAAPATVTPKRRRAAERALPG